MHVSQWKPCVFGTVGTSNGFSEVPIWPRECTQGHNLAFFLTLGFVGAGDVKICSILYQIDISISETYITCSQY